MAASNRGLLGQYAGLVTRAVALVIDIVVVSLSVVAINWFIAQPLIFFTGVNVGECILTPTDYGRILGTMCRFLGLTWTGVTLLTAPIYFIVLFSAYGQTIGKYVMGIRVVPRDGGRMTYKISIVRWLGYFASIFTFGIGFLWVLVDDHRQALHDRIAGTTVVYAWRARQNEFLLDRLRGWFRNHPKLATDAPKRVAANPHIDLLTIAVPNRNIVRRVMAMIQHGIAQHDFEVINISVLVTDGDRQIGVFGVSDLSATGEDFSVMDVKNELPPAQVAEIQADLPPDSFIIAILLHEQWGDDVVQLISRHAAAVIRRYDMGTEAPGSGPDGGQSPVSPSLMLTPSDTINPAQ